MIASDVKRQIREAEVKARCDYFEKRLHARPTPEHLFYPPRKWRFDFAWPDIKVALEVEGGVYMRGGGCHQHAGRFMGDMDKYNAATITGWAVLRCAPDQLYSTGTLTLLQAAFALRSK